MKTLNEICQFILDNDPKCLSILGRDVLKARLEIGLLGPLELKKAPTPGQVNVKFGLSHRLSVWLLLTDLEGKVDINVSWPADQAGVEDTFGFLQTLTTVSRLASYIKDHLET